MMLRREATRTLLSGWSIPFLLLLLLGGLLTPGRTAAQQPPLVLELTTERGSNPVYRLGEQMTVIVRSSGAAHLTCFYQQGDGALFRIFPNRHHPEPAITAEQPTRIPGPGAPFAFRFDHPLSIEAVTCFATRTAVTLAPPLAPDLEPLPLAGYEALREAFARVAEDAVSATVVMTVAE